MTTRHGLVYAAFLAAFSVMGCTQQGDPPQVESPTLDVTHWTEKTELFVEYPPLVAGQTVVFAVHLTTMADFLPLTAGQASVEFTPEAAAIPLAPAAEDAIAGL